MAGSRPRSVALWVLGAGLVWRAVFSFVVVPRWEASVNATFDPDSHAVLARSILERGVFGFDGHGADPTTVRGPGFPSWLALGIPLGGDGARFMAFWGGIPGLLTGALVTFLIARRWGSVPGAAAGAIAVAHPLPSLAAARVMGDDFAGAFGFAALAAWAYALNRRATAGTPGCGGGSGDPSTPTPPVREGRRAAVLWTAAAGLLLAWLILARASGIFTLIAAVGAGLVRRPRRPALTLLLAALALAPPFAWSIRSSLLEGRPVFVHSLAGYNFWVGEAFDRLGAGQESGPHWREVLRVVLPAGASRSRRRHGSGTAISRLARRRRSTRRWRARRSRASPPIPRATPPASSEGSRGSGTRRRLGREASSTSRPPSPCWPSLCWARVRSSGRPTRTAASP